MILGLMCHLPHHGIKIIRATAETEIKSHFLLAEPDWSNMACPCHSHAVRPDVETCDVVMLAPWYQTVYPRPGWSLIDILTQFYTGHYNVSSAVAGEGGGQSVECAADGVRGGSLSMDIWHIPWWHLSEYRGHIWESEPPLLHGPHPSPLSRLSMCPTFKFRAGEWAVCQRVGEKDGLTWTNWRTPLTVLAQWSPFWYLERGVVVTFFSNKNCIIAEWAESRSWAREWGEAVGNLDRVCGARKNFADVLIKNLTANWGRKTYSKSIYHWGAIICLCLISVIWHLSRWLS